MKFLDSYEKFDWQNYYGKREKLRKRDYCRDNGKIKKAYHVRQTNLFEIEEQLAKEGIVS